MECPRLPDKTGPVMTNKTFESVGSLLLFQALVLGGGITIGIVTAPGDWYAALVKPPYNPPNWIFAPVWTTLYILIAVAGWRIWKRGQDSWSMKIWWAQLVMNFIWSPIFFLAHRIDFALGVIILLLVTIIGFIIVSWRQDRMTSILFWPYAVWVGFASVLNGVLLHLNG